MTEEKKTASSAPQMPLGWTFQPGDKGVRSGSAIWGTEGGFIAIVVDPDSVSILLREYGRIYPLVRPPAEFDKPHQAVIWSAGHESLRLPTMDLAHQMLMSPLQPGYDRTAMMPRLVRMHSRLQVLSLDGVLEWEVELMPMTSEVSRQFIAMFMPPGMKF